VKQVRIESKTPINAPSFGNFTLDAAGNVWDARADKIAKLDPNTGKVLQEWPLQANSSYDNAISYDGRYWVVAVRRIGATQSRCWTLRLERF